MTKMKQQTEHITKACKPEEVSQTRVTLLERVKALEADVELLGTSGNKMYEFYVDQVKKMEAQSKRIRELEVQVNGTPG